MDNFERDRQLKQNIINVTKSIRAKYRALKNRKIETERKLHERFKPIMEPLKEIASHIKPEPTIDLALKSEKSTPTITKKFYHSTYGDEGDGATSIKKERFLSSDDDEIFESSAKEPLKSDQPDVGRRHPSQSVAQSPLQSVGEKAKEYIMLASVRNVKKNLDQTYGPYVDSKTDKWMIGNSVFEIIDDNFIINGITYPGTEGLFELIFKKYPDKKIYNEYDLNMYKDILKNTSAHKKCYDINAAINATRSYKYNQIISKLFPPLSRRMSASKQATLSGSGLMRYHDNQVIEYRYWNDVGELISRLKLLIASQQAGHNNHHQNEILSILEELREAEIIE